MASWFSTDAVLLTKQVLSLRSVKIYFDSGALAPKIFQQQGGLHHVNSPIAAHHPYLLGAH